MADGSALTQPCPFYSIDPILGMKVWCARPAGHDGEHDERHTT